MLRTQGMKHVALLALVACSSNAASTTAPIEAPAVAPVEAARTPSPAPKIEAAKVVSASVEKLGVKLEIDVAITTADRLQKNEWIDLKASCKLDGEWYGGSGYVHTRDMLPGTSVVPARVWLGTQHAFTQAPTECHIGVDYVSYVTKPAVKQSLARMCWMGHEVANQPCAAAPSDALMVSGLRLEPPRYRRTLGAPITLDASIDGQLARSLDDSTIELAADCMLPDGTHHAASQRVSTYNVHVGRPFTSRTFLFGRSSSLVDIPTACTLTIEIADRTKLVRAQAGTWCWKGGEAKSGACS